MTGDKNSFLSLEMRDGGMVTFGNNEKASIKGKGMIGKVNSAKIENVHFVEGLKHNLISISQLCDNALKLYLKLTLMKLNKHLLEKFFSMDQE